jgi:hypothetical protein
MQLDHRFFQPLRPEDIRSDLTLKYDDNLKNTTPYEIINGTVTFKYPVETPKITLNEISPIDGVVKINGVLRADVIETKQHIKITSLEFLDHKTINGDLNIKGDFNIEGNINWSGKTNYIDSEIIRAEDNLIYLNHKGNHQTSKNGGIVLVKGIDEERDCNITIDESGYWNIYPGVNIPVLNVETINFEEEENGMLIGYLNGNKIGIPYKKLK